MLLLSTVGLMNLVHHRTYAYSMYFNYRNVSCNEIYFLDLPVESYKVHAFINDAVKVVSPSHDIPHNMSLLPYPFMLKHRYFYRNTCMRFVTSHKNNPIIFLTCLCHPPFMLEHQYFYRNTCMRFVTSPHRNNPSNNIKILERGGGWYF